MLGLWLRMHAQQIDLITTQIDYGHHLVLGDIIGFLPFMQLLRLFTYLNVQGM